MQRSGSRSSAFWLNREVKKRIMTATSQELQPIQHSGRLRGKAAIMTGADVMGIDIDGPSSTLEVAPTTPGELAETGEWSRPLGRADHVAAAWSQAVLTDNFSLLWGGSRKGRGINFWT